MCTISCFQTPSVQLPASVKLCTLKMVMTVPPQPLSPPQRGLTSVASLVGTLKGSSSARLAVRQTCAPCVEEITETRTLKLSYCCGTSTHTYQPKKFFAGQTLRFCRILLIFAGHPPPPGPHVQPAPIANSVCLL